ncbi:MAG: metallophosphoesterase family protein [Promethearchaeota archaeon]
MKLINDFLKEKSRRFQILWLFCFLGAPIITAILMIWLFNLHGSVGLFFWFPPFTFAVIILIIFVVLGPLFLFLESRAYIKKRKFSGILKKFSIVACLTCIILSSGVFIYIIPNLYSTPKNTDHQLLICDGTGKYGIPDVAITFWTEQKEKYSVKWGNQSLSNTIKEDEVKNCHVFVLEDLAPNTEYWYQISDNDIVYKFRTPILTNNSLRFAVSSDPHFGREESKNDITEEILKQITNKNHNISAFFMLGDFVEYGFDQSEWIEGLNAISPYTSNIMFRPAIGNHDTILGGEKYYKDYFYPEDMPLDTGSQLYYRIDFNNIHFFILDLEWGVETYSNAQKEWFEDELKKTDKDDWIIVMSHCFYYSSGDIYGGRSWADQQDMINTFEDLFKEYDVDLVFSGHNHHVEILEKDGIYYHIVGAFGGLPDPKAGIKSDYSEWYMNIEKDSQFGFFEVDIHGNNATITYRNSDYENIHQIVVNE